MELVIKIPDSVYEKVLAIKGTDEELCFEDKLQLEIALEDGTPLPKGHGTLKDVDNIKTAFPSGEYVRTESVRATIDHEDTIIEADKENEDETSNKV